MASTAEEVITDVGGVAAAIFNFTKPHKQLAITNYHATQILYVTKASSVVSGTAANTAVDALADPTAGAEDVWTIPAGKRVVIAKSRKPLYFAFNVLGSGASTSFTAEATDWTDGA